MDDKYILIILVLSLIIILSIMAMCFLQAQTMSCQGYQFKIPRVFEQYQPSMMQQPPTQQSPQYVTALVPKETPRLWQSTGYSN